MAYQILSEPTPDFRTIQGVSDLVAALAASHLDIVASRIHKRIRVEREEIG
jgi:hypothetical protein